MTSDPRRARDVAALLTPRLRDLEPRFLVSAGVDLGPALEQQLYFALRDGLPPSGGLRSVRATARTMGLRAATWALARVPRARPVVARGSILVLVRHAVHVRIFGPVAESLREAGGPPATVVRVGAAAAERRLSSAGPRLDAVLDPQAIRAVGAPRLDTRRLGAEWAVAASDLAHADVQQLVAHAVRTRAQLAVAAALLAAAVRRYGPSVLATYDEVGSWGRLVAAAARAAGVPSLDLPHAEAADPVGTRGAGYDAMAVFGPISTARLREAGIDPERIVEVGPPHLDALVRASRSTPSFDARVADGRRILFTSQHTAGTMTPAVKERTFRAAVQAAAAAAPCVLVIRPHPVERDHIIERVTAEPPPEGVRIITDRQRSLPELLGEAWIMVTGSSQTVLEAAIAGVPSVSINATGGPDPVTYAAESIAIGATDGGSAAEVVTGLLDRGPWLAQVATARSALEPHLGPLDGNAAMRTAELIVRLSGSGASGFHV